MAIVALEIQRFKAFSDRAFMRLRPVTILAGTNSSGKSSLIHALMLLKQSSFRGSYNALHLEGEYLSYRDIEEMTFGLSLKEGAPHISLTVATNIDDDFATTFFSSETTVKATAPKSLFGCADFAFDQKPDRGRATRILVEEFHLKCGIGTSLNDVAWGPELKYKRLDGKMPELSISGLPESYNKSLADVTDIDWNGFLPHCLLRRTGYDDNELYFPSKQEKLPAVFNEIIGGLDKDISSRLSYLGPLRLPPQRRYEHSPQRTQEIGPAGERTGEVLAERGEELVPLRTGVGENLREVPLLQAVKEVFKNLEIRQLPHVLADPNSIYYQIMFQGDKAATSLKLPISDVGFGLSQILPVIVLGLLASEESLIVLEQPEIHLHPRLQANLANFLITLALSGKRVLVETHSDHLLNQLRLRVAEDSSGKLQKLLQLYFVSAPVEGSCEGATLASFELNDYGNFPKEFFPESAVRSEKILKAQIAKRRSRTKKKND